MRHIAGLVAIATTFVLMVGSTSAAPSRDTLIRPGVGIGKVNLGMTYGAVRNALGRPSTVLEKRRFGFGSYFVLYAWGLAPKWTVGVLGRGDRARVVSVASTLRREKTPSGVGVGSTDRAVQRALGARCFADWGHTEAVTGRYCFVGKRGKPRTFFYGTRKCAVPETRYQLCPDGKLTFRVYEVLIANRDGLRLLNLYAD